MKTKDLRRRTPVDDVASEDEPRGVSRRSFLRAATVAAGTTAIVAHAGASANAGELEPEDDPGQLAREHADDPGMLIDITKCVGCGKCVRACKLDNDLEWRQDQPATGTEAELASSNWTVVRAEGVETVQDSRLGPRLRAGRRYVKFQCLHCLEPACASACFVAALHKTEEGPVVYDGNRCVGCRYCLLACPFGVPTFEWDEAFGRVQKCDLCVDRTSQGEPTACAEACPQGAITFGRRGDLLEEAWRRIRSDEHYAQQVYGETEVAGTSVMYVSDVPFEELGFRTGVAVDPLPTYTWEVTRILPPFAAGFTVTIMALWARRQKIQRERAAAEAQGEEEVVS
ncbi:MAG TPA: 4Fe-4S dicluster domain-containing protein [Actinomycetota bacterium]|nr:4Fe-4S dicluster domain-containing protein [Actinomycetota bacterium]